MNQEAAGREELRAVLDRLADELARAGAVYPGHLRMLVRRATALADEARVPVPGLTEGLERLGGVVESPASTGALAAASLQLAGRLKGFARALAKAPPPDPDSGTGPWHRGEA